WVGDFEIRPSVVVSISPKFSKQIAGGPPVLLTASVSNDAMDAGVTWSLTADGVDCSPVCGVLKPGTGGPPFTATYQPPATVPLGANASPKITATSVTQSSKSDGFSFSIL